MLPAYGVFKMHLKNHKRYADLNAQSSQVILEELGEASDSCYGHREGGNGKTNPPDYRKHGNDHSTGNLEIESSIVYIFC